MFEQLNELKYNAQNGKTYLIYFLKYWKIRERGGDFIVKYQIRSSAKDFIWYGRVSEERALSDLKLTPKHIQTVPQKELDDKIEGYLKRLFVYIAKKGLDKGYEEADAEFVFCRDRSIIKRIWGG